jgi:hypothetical protein
MFVFFCKLEQNILAVKFEKPKKLLYIWVNQSIYGKILVMPYKTIFVF